MIHLLVMGDELENAAVQVMRKEDGTRDKKWLGGRRVWVSRNETNPLNKSSTISNIKRFIS